MPDLKLQSKATPLFWLAVLLLPGCLPFLPQNTDYRLDISHSGGDTQEYLQTILDDRLKDEIEEEEGSIDFERAETYREETIRGDLIRAAKAKGYYDVDVTYEDGSEPLSGTYDIDLGDQYTISSIEVDPGAFQDELSVTTVNQGDILAARPILEAESELFKAVQKDTCFYDMSIEHFVVLDKKAKTGALEFVVDVSPPATFGPAIFKGQKTVELEYLQKHVTWNEGDCFRREKIEALKTDLLETGLFSRVDSILPETPDFENNIPVTLQLKERAHRTVKAGASYYTDEGFGVVLSWEHRNFFGQAEKLETQLRLSQIEQEASLDFTKPYFIREDQTLNLNGSFGHEDTDAYRETGFETGAAINRSFTDHLSASAGAAFSFSEIEDQDGTETYGLFSVPTSVKYDTRDNPLDAHKGVVLTASIEPFFDTLGESDPFTKLQAGANHYIDFGDDPDIVLAMRAGIGSIVGGSIGNIPANERFYAGGGGSVRGYGYQEVGPFQNGEPSGGRSLATGSAELRFKFTPTLGGVAFVDAGSVSESPTPDFDNFSVGAGIGARYYTGFGPLRLDVGVPLNNKDDLSNDFQLYISIGQAF